MRRITNLDFRKDKEVHGNWRRLPFSASKLCFIIIGRHPVKIHLKDKISQKGQMELPANWSGPQVEKMERKTCSSTKKIWYYYNVKQYVMVTLMNKIEETIVKMVQNFILEKKVWETKKFFFFNLNFLTNRDDTHTFKCLFYNSKLNIF